MVKVQKIKPRKTTGGYREGSRISKALDVLALEGIDCVRIGQRNEHSGYRPGRKTLYFPINMFKDRNFIADLYECGAWIVTKGDMEIEVDTMAGYEIKEYKPEWKIENKLYDVIKISYGYTPIVPIRVAYSPFKSSL